MWTTILLLVYCAFIVAASLLGGWIPMIVRLTHTRMQVVISFVSGLMLGVAALHLLPHAMAHLDSFDGTMRWMLFGLLATFFLLRIFHFHSHAPMEDGESHGHGEHHDCGHEHHHYELGEPDLSSNHEQATSHRMGWVGLAFGLAVHTLLDGVALGASVVAESHGHNELALLGFGTFLAILLHKPLDAMSITSLMTQTGWSLRARLMINILFSLMCPVGALLIVVSVGSLADGRVEFVGIALAFSAGVFLCLSLGDLLPEVQFHHHDRWKLSFALILGIALAVAIEMLPGHSHDTHQHHSHQAPRDSDDPQPHEPADEHDTHDHTGHKHD